MNTHWQYKSRLLIILLLSSFVAWIPLDFSLHVQVTPNVNFVAVMCFSHFRKRIDMKIMQQHKTVISCDKHIPGNWYALREWQSIACQLKKIFYILASFLLISQPAEIIRGVLNLTLFYCNSYLKIILSYLLHIQYMWLSTRILITRNRDF